MDKYLNIIYEILWMDWISRENDTTSWYLIMFLGSTMARTKDGGHASSGQDLGTTEWRNEKEDRGGAT